MATSLPDEHCAWHHLGTTCTTLGHHLGRALHFAWCSPIMRWSKIMFSKSVCYDFVSRRHKSNIDKQSDERRCLGYWETYLLKATYTDGGDNSSEGDRAPRGVGRGLVVIPVSRCCPIATTDHLQLHGTLFNWLGKVNISKVKAMLTCIKSQPFSLAILQHSSFGFGYRHQPLWSGQLNSPRPLCSTV